VRRRDAARPPPPVHTLRPEEISRFLVRHRRTPDVNRPEQPLDAHLGAMLAKAGRFVPSRAGALLLDDPRAKRYELQRNTLTVISAFGPQSQGLLGVRVPCGRGILGRVYTTGRPHISDRVATDPLFVPSADRVPAFRPRCLLIVPIVVGDSVCGVVELANREGGGRFTANDLELLSVLSANMAAAIQNALHVLQARELARRDALTGLFNDRYLAVRLREEIARAEADRTFLSLLVLDLDFFKRVNDTHGHLAGSRTLQEFGTLLREELPPGAVAARYGGDEFVVILPGADSRRARAVAEQLRRQVQRTTFLAEAGPGGLPALRLRGITSSFGVAALHEHVALAGPPEWRRNALFRQADSAMYRAKALGKNRVEVAEVEPADGTTKAARAPRPRASA
jgi:diguanylate cyclase (GGDEF)-like protein